MPLSRTVIRVYGVLRQIMKFAASRGYLAFDLCLNVKLPRTALRASEPRSHLVG